MVRIIVVSLNERKILSNAGDRIPLGALYITTALRNAGHTAVFLDMNHDGKDKLERLLKEEFDYVAISMISSPSYKEALKVNKLAKKYGKKTIIGGYHATIRPQDFKDVDYVIRGDGEEAIVNLMEGKPIEDKIHINDVNYVPFPDRWIPMYFLYNMKQNGKLTATIITSKGCPFNCVFCGNYDRKVRYRKPENVREELKIIKEQGYEALYVLDDAFTVNKEHFKTMSNLFKEFNLPYRATTRSDLINESVVMQLRDTGCEIISLGIESGNNKILKNCNKNTTVQNHEMAIKLLHQYGINIKGFFIFGLPEEGLQEAEETINFAVRMKKFGLNSADFYAMTPFPGSDLYNNPKKYGVKILTKNWSKYLEAGKELIEPIIETDKLTSKQIKQLIERANHEFRTA